jgi:hypothetical protein
MAFRGMANYVTSSTEKKFKHMLLSGIIMVVTGFWNEKGVAFVNFLPRGTAVNSDHCDGIKKPEC